jgi:hypothetical protein
MDPWPEKLISARVIVSVIRDAFDELGDALGVITRVRNGMWEKSQLHWWAEAEYDITQNLPIALRDLTGVSWQKAIIEGKHVSKIMDICRRMADLDEFHLPQNILDKLPDNNAPPSLSLDAPDVFDAKLEAVRRQVVNVMLKYHRYRGVLRPLEELVEKLEEEVKCHKQNIIGSA